MQSILTGDGSLSNSKALNYIFVVWSALSQMSVLCGSSKFGYTELKAKLCEVQAGDGSLVLSICPPGVYLSRARTRD